MLIGRVGTQRFYYKTTDSYANIRAKRAAYRTAIVQSQEKARLRERIIARESGAEDRERVRLEEKRQELGLPPERREVQEAIQSRVGVSPGTERVGGGMSGSFEETVRQNRLDAARRSGRNLEQYGNVRVSAAAPQPGVTTDVGTEERRIASEKQLDAAVEAEYNRLAAKYPKRVGYISRENIRRKLTGPAKVYDPERYPGYDKKAAQRQLTREQVESMDRSSEFKTPQGRKVISGMPRARYLTSRATIPYTKGMGAAYGGAMEGELTPEAASQLGFAKLYEKRAARAGVTELEGQFEGVGTKPVKRYKVENVPGLETTTFTSEASAQAAAERANTRAEEAARIRALTETPGGSTDIVARQGGLNSFQRTAWTPWQGYVPVQTTVDKPKVLRSQFFDIPRGYEVGSIKYTPTGGEVTIQEKPVDMGEYDKVLAQQIEATRFKTPGIRQIDDILAQPLVRYAASELRQIEYEKRSALQKAKTPAESRKIEAVAAAKVEKLKDPFDIQVTMEPPGARYAVDREGKPIKSIPYRVFKEVTERPLQFDAPIVDVKLGPAAGAAVTGLALGYSIFATPVVAGAKTIGGTLYASATGGTQFLGFSGVSQKVTEVTGKPGLGFLAGGFAAKGIGQVSKSVRARYVPYKEAQLTADALKRTGEFKVGQKGVATTRIREVAATRGTTLIGKTPSKAYIRGRIPETGVAAPKPLGQTTIGYGRRIGGEIPVQVRLTDAFGETITIPTVRAKTTLKTTDVGLGRGFQPTTTPSGTPQISRARAGLAFDPLRRGIGGRQPLAQQDFISTAYAGVGKKQVGVVTTGRGLTGVTKPVGVSVSTGVRKLGDKPQLIYSKRVQPGVGGYYEPSRDLITVKTGLKPKVEQRIISHEFGHSLDLRRGIDAKYPYTTPFGRLVQELRAEKYAIPEGGLPEYYLRGIKKPSPGMTVGATIPKQTVGAGVGGTRGITGRLMFAKKAVREAKSFGEEYRAFRKNFPYTKGAPTRLLEEKVGVFTTEKGLFGKPLITKPITSYRTVGVQTSTEFGVAPKPGDMQRFELGVTRQAVRVGKELRGSERIQIKTGALTVKADFPRVIERFESLKVGGPPGGGLRIKQVFTPPTTYKPSGGTAPIGVKQVSVTETILKAPTKAKTDVVGLVSRAKAAVAKAEQTRQAQTFQAALPPVVQQRGPTVRTGRRTVETTGLQQQLVREPGQASVFEQDFMGVPMKPTVTEFEVGGETIFQRVSKPDVPILKYRQRQRQTVVPRLDQQPKQQIIQKPVQKIIQQPALVQVPQVKQELRQKLVQDKILRFDYKVPPTRNYIIRQGWGAFGGVGGPGFPPFIFGPPGGRLPKQVRGRVSRERFTRSYVPTYSDIIRGFGKSDLDDYVAVGKRKKTKKKVKKK